jgi:putative hemolysin
MQEDAMFKKFLPLISILLLSILLAACQDNANMPNPASVYCEENGGTLEIREDESGGQVGYCQFPDGSECEEWAFYRGECQPGDSLEGNANMPNPASVYCEENGGALDMREDESGGQVGYCQFPDGSECEEWAFFRGECQVGDFYPASDVAEDGWNVFRNEALGLTFHYPPDAIITTADNPEKTLTIQGPMVDDEYWPMIYFNYPSDRLEYTPPENVVLESWLTANNLLEGERLDDLTIAGVPAIHLRLDRSEQSYASDRFFFIKGVQLFNVVILHTGDKEDWDLYNHFLESIQIDQ